ncbi:MAG: hypothetical protein ACTSQE_08855 [Candidatus Heimdallarchaeaceae archaeon]
MVNETKEEKDRHDLTTVVSKNFLVTMFAMPLIFGVLGIIIAYLITMGLTEKVRKIALIVGAFVGLLTSIGLAFIIQWKIKKKIEKMKQKEKPIDEQE